MDISDAVSQLGIQPLRLEPGDVIEHAIVIIKTANADDYPASHRALSPGLGHWEAIGLLTDALDGLRAAGWDAER